MPKRPQPSRTTSQNAKLRASVHSGEYTIAIYKSKVRLYAPLEAVSSRRLSY